MKHKLTGILCCICILFSSFGVQAAKRKTKEIATTTNLVGMFGSFASESEVEGNKRLSLRGAVCEWSNDDADGIGGSLKVSTTRNYGRFCVAVPNLIGETYEISFWAKTDGVTKQLIYIPTFTDTWDTIALTDNADGKWKKYSCTYTCDGKDYLNHTVQSDIVNMFNIRIGDGIEQVTFWIDGLTLTPKGNVSFDWTSWIEAAQKKDAYPSPVEQEITDVSFSDIEGHWAESEISVLASNKYINGNGDGRFEPNAPLTRAEFVTVVTNALRWEKKTSASAFSDVSGTEWYFASLSALMETDTLPKTWCAQDCFYPNNTVNRIEAAYIFSQALKASRTPENVQVPAYTDIESLSDEEKQGISDAQAFGLIRGYEDATFHPYDTLTRAQAAQIMYRVIENFCPLAIFVDGQNGDDTQNGTKEHPLKTIEKAKNVIRPYLKNMRHNIYVYLSSGEYTLYNSVDWTEDDSGQNGFSVIYEGKDSQNMPQISAGRTYQNFSVYDAEQEIYRTYVGAERPIRQAFFNGVRGVRARTDICFEGILNNSSFDSENGVFTCDNSELAACRNTSEMECVYFEKWTNPRVKISDIQQIDGKTCITLNPTSWAQVGSQSNLINNHPAYIENAYELIDTPGEWYYNKTDGYLYYKLRSFDDADTLTLTVPTVERAFTVAGKSADDKVHDLIFRNLDFIYTAWNFPNNTSAYRDNQSNYVASYAGDGRLTGGKEDAAFVIADAENIGVYDCTFRKLGGAGINCREIFSNIQIVGNHFYDLSASGINLGIANVETKDYDKYVNPYDTKHYRINNVIANNYIHDIGIDYQSSVGINVSWVKNTQIYHNEIFNSNYCGLHIGWGWTDYQQRGTATDGLEIRNNYIHETMNSHLYDGAAIYMVGATGGNKNAYNQIAENYIENVRNAYAGLYSDEGSTYWEYTRNVVDFREVKPWVGDGNGSPFKWFTQTAPTIYHNKLTDNFTTVDDMSLRYPENDNIEAGTKVVVNPQEDVQANTIVQNAGLESQYAEKYDDAVQRIELSIAETPCYIGLNEKIDISPQAFGRKLVKSEFNKTSISYYTTDASVASVDADGMLTGVFDGTCRIYMQYLDEDLLVRERYFDVIVNDHVTEINVGISALGMLEGHSYTLRPIGKTSFGNQRHITDVSYTSDDPEIASVTSDGVITANKNGKTSIHAEYRANDFVKRETYPISVVQYTKENSTELLQQSRKLLYRDPIFRSDNWTQGKTQNAAKELSDGGIKIADSGVMYYKTKIQNELLSFDMVIHNPNSWPSITFCADDTALNFNKGTSYMIGFKENIIELQRFNGGVRTMIFGDDNFSPVGGPGLPNKDADGNRLFEYGKTYSVTVGTLDTENGTRIVLMIDDVPVIDYTDVGDGHITGGGYFGIYALQGDFMLYPYSK